MNVLGVSPLDRDATACLVTNGRVEYAIAEERLSRKKMQTGFPSRSVEFILNTLELKPDEIDVIAYPFYDWDTEAKLKIGNFLSYIFHFPLGQNVLTFRNLKGMAEDIYESLFIDGLPPEKWHMKKSVIKRILYKIGGGNAIGDTLMGIFFELNNTIKSIRSHYKYNKELMSHIDRLGLTHKLVRVNHHKAHAANAYFTSGLEKALVVTLDGYGSGLAGSVSIGRGNSIQTIHELCYPHSLGMFYESITSALGFTPSRHEGKIVGLAAYGDEKRLTPAILGRFVDSPGNFFYLSGSNDLFHRSLSTRFTKMTVAAAYQKALELVSTKYIRHYVTSTGIENVSLSGGVAANVKNNQRIFEIPGVKRIFVHPNMGDGGCSVGAALLCSNLPHLKSKPIKDVYWGPEYFKEEITDALNEENLFFEEPEDIEKLVAKLIDGGHIVARFCGRMEYGPRALGNRSILYHAKDPNVNQWLNQQLGRTEFMPFAPATLYEYRHEYYRNMNGADLPAQFMTVTFDCTKRMIRECPAAVHIDGTARPQLVRKEVSPGFYTIIDEYRRLTGIPTIINTSFNMHEEPIVCTPKDALRAFKLGHLHYLAIGPYLVEGSKLH